MIQVLTVPGTLWVIVVHCFIAILHPCVIYVSVANRDNGLDASWHSRSSNADEANPSLWVWLSGLGRIRSDCGPLRVWPIELVHSDVLLWLHLEQ